MLYSKFKNIVKKINETFLGRLLLLIPLVLYFKSKQIGFRSSNFFYSYFYYYSGKLCRNNDLTIGIKILGSKKTIFPHPVGIVIGKHVKIGMNCMVYQNVTIGAKTNYHACMKQYPVIGDNVVIGANSVIIGNINIGNNVIIGASTLVNKDIPDDTIVYGNPAKLHNSSGVKNSE